MGANKAKISVQQYASPLFHSMASLMATYEINSICEKVYAACWKNDSERVNVSECCVMVGLAHSKFPFPYDMLLMLTFLQLNSSS